MNGDAAPGEDAGELGAGGEVVGADEGTAVGGETGTAAGGNTGTAVGGEMGADFGGETVGAADGDWARAVATRREIAKARNWTDEIAIAEGLKRGVERREREEARGPQVKKRTARETIKQSQGRKEIFNYSLGQMKHVSRKPGEHFWPKMVLRKWLNIGNKDNDYSADEGDAESMDESEDLEHEERSTSGLNDNRFPYTSRRRNSETFRTQYINTKELRICIGTWNVGGKFPQEDLAIEEWLDMDVPADIYVLGLQEIVPLNARNVFGAEDNSPVPRWENIIRQRLNKIHPTKPKYKCYSDPPSPSRFKPSDDALLTVDEILPESDSENEDKIYPMDEHSYSLQMDSDGYAASIDSKCSLTSSVDSSIPQEADQRKRPAMKSFNRCHGFSVINYKEFPDTPISQQKRLTKTLSSSERISMIWPEQQLDLSVNRAIDRLNSFKSVKSFKASSSFKAMPGKNRDSSEISLIPDLDLDAMLGKKRPPFLRIISKQMVGVFLTVWVRRSLRKHIQNLKVSTVGVGAMGYIGNKGSISVSMSIHQTLFCFVCTHLSSGEKSGDELRRNADVQEILQRTHFGTAPGMSLPKRINDHDRIFWFGDLNYRINLSYEKTHELISRSEWSTLLERDQLTRELKKGRAFDGWSEGVLDFPPTYKYEFNSEKYIGANSTALRRVPAWCDRILSFGKGIKLFRYKRAEMKLSDHRPVTATYTAEVEVFNQRKLQKALILTDAEMGDGDIIADME